jgi:uncharacterized membrane protein required for colicin V production
MHLADLLVLVVILLSAWSGWRSGFIYAATGLIMRVGSLAAAFCLYPYAVRPLTNFAPGLGRDRLAFYGAAVIGQADGSTASKSVGR